jgi:hypothetical protein
MKPRELVPARVGMPFHLMFWSLALVLLVACCSASLAETSARSAVNVIGDTVDASYALAVQGCKDLEGEAMAAGESGVRTAADTQQTIVEISTRCHKITDAFDEIRAFHEQAIALIEDGEYERALAAIQQVREAWVTLKERTGTP